MFINSNKNKGRLLEVLKQKLMNQKENERISENTKAVSLKNKMKYKNTFSAARFLTLALREDHALVWVLFCALC